jgi:hypothetical protein
VKTEAEIDADFASRERQSDDETNHGLEDGQAYRLAELVEEGPFDDDAEQLALFAEKGSGS